MLVWQEQWWKPRNLSKRVVNWITGNGEYEWEKPAITSSDTATDDECRFMQMNVSSHYPLLRKMKLNAIYTYHIYMTTRVCRTVNKVGNELNIEKIQGLRRAFYPKWIDPSINFSPLHYAVSVRLSELRGNTTNIVNHLFGKDPLNQSWKSKQQQKYCC